MFLELNACQSSCVNGPCSLNKKSTAITSNAKVRKYVSENQSNAEQSVYNKETNVDIRCDYVQTKCGEKTPTEEEIKEVLAKTGKTRPEDELNCGACGLYHHHPYPSSHRKKRFPHRVFWPDIGHGNGRSFAP